MKENYLSIFAKNVDEIKDNGLYRNFIPIANKSDSYRAKVSSKDITLWSSQDFMAMGSNKEVQDTIYKSIDILGLGAGGSRNISGNTKAHELLEKTLSEWHKKESSLLFNSGYVANLSTLSTLNSIISGCIFISDENNHNSIIQGLKNTKKFIFKHNNMIDIRENIILY